MQPQNDNKPHDFTERTEALFSCFKSEKIEEQMKALAELQKGMANAR